MSVADSLYNLHLIKEFCESSLQNCCPLAVEDLLYAPPVLHVSILTFHMSKTGVWMEKYYHTDCKGCSLLAATGVTNRRYH